jgi:hypothetical protein
MYDKSRSKKATGEMPRPEMGGATAATEMPTGEMNSGGYPDASGGAQAASSGGTGSPSLYDEMFGLHDIRADATASGTMPEASSTVSAANGATAEGPMPGAAVAAESASGQHTIEITGRWRVTLTPAP